LRGFQRVDKRMFSTGEIIFLYVDDEEGCFHVLKYTGIQVHK
jgi:hypothetical protein